MIDLDALRQMKALDEEGRAAFVTQGWLQRVIEELEAGRRAQAELQRLNATGGAMFGLKGNTI